MDFVLVFNDSPFGSQRTFNGLRLASGLAEEASIGIFLLGDGVTAALAGLAPADADYNPQAMLCAIAERGHPIFACGTCMEARGLSPAALIPGVSRGTLVQLVDWCKTVPKVLTF